MSARENNWVGANLREARLTKGMTQADLGRQLGYSAMAISHFENGIRTIRINDLEKASQILGQKISVTKDSVGQQKKATLFRANGSRGSSMTMRSLNAFDRHIEKKYGNLEGA